ncbi:MAG: nonstructural protein [Microvirus sp.]|nr:MAG: nonstructural protein [Microvirus sp.]
MLVQVFSVMDVKVGGFAQPFFAATVASAQRSFMAATQDQSTMLGQYPADFQLWHISEFDDNTAKFSPIQPEMICTGESIGVPNA